MLRLIIILSIALLMALGCPTIASGAPAHPTLPGCPSERVLGACKRVIEAQDREVAALKKAVQDMEHRLEDSRPRELFDFIPEWLKLSLAAIAGVYIGTHLNH